MSRVSQIMVSLMHEWNFMIIIRNQDWNEGDDQPCLIPVQEDSIRQERQE